MPSLEHKWSAYLPFARFMRSDVQTITLFVILGPVIGLMVLGFVRGSIVAAIFFPLFVLIFGWLFVPKIFVMMMLLMAILPAYAAGLGALAVRGWNSVVLCIISAVVLGCGAEFLLACTLFYKFAEFRSQLLTAAAVSAVVCTIATFNLRGRNGNS